MTPLIRTSPLPFVRAGCVESTCSMAKSKRGTGPGRLLLGFVLGMITAAGAAFGYLHFYKPRVASMDRPSPFQRHSENVPLRPQRTLSKESTLTKTMTPPFGASEDAFEGGAQVYRAQCAKCHGAPGQDAALARTMKPPATQLWKKVSKGAVSVERPGDTYEKVANGVRSTGMPAYKHILSDTQLWQVSLLLANADKELPGPVVRILTGP